MGKRIRLTEALRKILLNPAAVPGEISIHGRVYKVVRPVAAGLKSAVWQVKDGFGRDRAVKLATQDDYRDRSYLQEVSRASELERCRSFARFDDAGPAEVRLAGVGRKHFICFVEEWIDGITLQSFLESHSEEVTVSFFLGYVRGLCNALSTLAVVGLHHDDLHAGNVMIASPPKGDLSAERSIKVIDTGSLKPQSLPARKPKDDHRHFIEHLVAIWNVIRSRKNLPVRDHRFLAEAQRLFDTMLDEDPGVALRDPAQIAKSFELAHTRAYASRSQHRQGLASPFEFISAEHIADDRLLVSIFAKSCPWLEKVSGPDPCLVTGPRGCGKSTIFRWLSLKAHLHKPSADIDALPLAGFYISCSTDLQNRVGWVKTQALAERFRKEIVHYFNLLFAREIVHTLELIGGRSDSDSYWGFGRVQEKEIHQYVMSAIGGPQPCLQGVPRSTQAREALEAEMYRAHSQMLKGQALPYTTPETFLGDFTDLLKKNVRFFAAKSIALLVDDFSVHRIPQPVQVVLNRVIWERRGTHVFKLSSEKHGAVLNDSFQATADVTREMVEVDCGREYIALDDTNQTKKALAFAVELLDNRLKAAKYKGTAETLIGHSQWPEGSLGRVLAEKAKGRTLGQYHGIECIAQLCSGDVASLLLVYGRILETANVDRDTTTCVGKNIQDGAIREVSRRLLEAIKPAFPCGPQMYDIVCAFGNLVPKQAYCPEREVDQGA